MTFTRISTLVWINNTFITKRPELLKNLGPLSILFFFFCEFPVPFYTLEVNTPLKSHRSWISCPFCNRNSFCSWQEFRWSVTTHKAIKTSEDVDKRHASIDSLTQDNGRKQLLPLIFIFCGYDKILSQKEFEEVLTSQFRGYSLSLHGSDRNGLLGAVGRVCVCSSRVMEVGFLSAWPFSILTSPGLQA